MEATAAAYQAVQDLRGVITGRLRLGAYPVSPAVLPFGRWLAGFARGHPGLDIAVRQASGVRMLRMVADGELDCALLDPLPGRTAGLDVLPLAAEPLVLACPADHPLAAAERVPLGRLDGEAFVETDRAWTTRVRTDEAFAGARLSRRITCEVGDWSLLLDLVSAGLGLALVPGSTRLDPVAGWDRTVRLVPLAGDGIERRVDLVLPRGHAASPAARRFARHLRGAVRGAPPE
jgi:DNA-binding transcriptional LysR family regulator